MSLSSKVNKNKKAIRVKLRDDVLEMFKEQLREFNERNKRMKMKS